MMKGVVGINIVQFSAAPIKMAPRLKRSIGSRIKRDEDS